MEDIKDLLLFIFVMNFQWTMLALTGIYLIVG